MSEYPSYLIHYGIQGQKWGVRRFQNEDGTWTEDGLVRRRKDQEHFVRKQERLGKRFDKYTEKIKRDQTAGKKISNRRVEKATKLGTKFRTLDYISKDPETYLEARKQGKKSAVKFGLNVAASAAAIAIATDTAITNKELREIAERRHKYDDIKINEIKVNGIKVNEIKVNEIKLNENVIRENVIRENVITYDNVKTATFDNSSKTFDKASNVKGAAASTVASTIGRYVPPVAIGIAAANIGRSTHNFIKENKAIRNTLKEHYGDAINKSRSETVKDLKKHGIYNKTSEISDAKQSRIKSLLSSGKSQSEVADILGISESTVRKYK